MISKTISDHSILEKLDGGDMGKGGTGTLSVNGQMGFVVVEKPAGVATVKALPADVQPKQVGSVTYLVYSDAAGQESYIVVDPPKTA